MEIPINSSSSQKLSTRFVALQKYNTNLKIWEEEGYLKRPSLYSPQEFRLAAALWEIFQPGNVALPSKCSAWSNCRDLHSKRLSLTLAYEALKYKDVYEDVLEKVKFYISYPKLKQDTSLLMVVLHDIRSRKFLPEIICPITDADIKDIEIIILKMKITLASAFAKLRILRNAKSFLDLISPSMNKFNFDISSLPVWAWVNQYKCSILEMIERLTEIGMHKSSNSCQLRNDQYYVDQDFPDLIKFCPQDRFKLSQLGLIQNSWLIFQDKSESLAPYLFKQALLHKCQNCKDPNERVLARLLEKPIPDILEKGDLAISQARSGWTSARLSSILLDLEFKGTIFVFDAHVNTIKGLLKRLNIKNISPINKPMTKELVDDKKFFDVQAVLVNPKDSASAIRDPVSYMFTEGEDPELMKHFIKTNENENLEELHSKSWNQLFAASRFPKVEAVIYTTHSANNEENEKVLFDFTPVSSGVRPLSSPEQELYNFKVVDINKLIKNDSQLLKNFLPKKEGIGYLNMAPTNDMDGTFIAALLKEKKIVRVENNMENNLHNIISDVSTTSHKKKKGKLSSKEYRRRQGYKQRLQNVALSFMKPELNSKTLKEENLPRKKILESRTRSLTNAFDPAFLEKFQKKPYPVQKHTFYFDFQEQEKVYTNSLENTMLKYE